MADRARSVRRPAGLVLGAAILGPRHAGSMGGTGALIGGGPRRHPRPAAHRPGTLLHHQGSRPAPARSAPNGLDLLLPRHMSSGAPAAATAAAISCWHRGVLGHHLRPPDLDPQALLRPVPVRRALGARRLQQETRKPQIRTVYAKAAWAIALTSSHLDMGPTGGRARRRQPARVATCTPGPGRFSPLASLGHQPRHNSMLTLSTADVPNGHARNPRAALRVRRCPHPPRQEEAAHTCIGAARNLGRRPPVRVAHRHVGTA
jgi:hypothetical protein